MGVRRNRISNSIKNEDKREVVIVNNHIDSISYDEIMEADLLNSATNSKAYANYSVQSAMVLELLSRAVSPAGRTGPLIAKIPVVLSELKIKINCSTIIKFKFPALEVTGIKRKVFLTECKIIPECKKLFISGYVRKDIEYASSGYSNSKSINIIRHMFLNIPFKGVTSIDYSTCPVIHKGEEPREIGIMNEDFSVHNFHSSEYINDKIYCELLQTEIDEIYSVLDYGNRKYKSQKIIKSLSEEMILKITLRLMQNQCVSITG
jgi:hypothetical protein